MKIYKTQAEVEADIKDGILRVEGDVKFECSINVSASLYIAGNITSRNITAEDITAWNINARDITAWNITSRNITSRNITAEDINARDITAWDITAWDITAGNILYYAFCCVYQGIRCSSIKAKKEIHHEPICLEGKLEIKKDTLVGKEATVEIDGKKYKALIKSEE